MMENRAAAAAHELDAVEIIADDAEVPRGTLATVIDDPGDGTLLLEVVGQNGQTIGLPVVARDAVRVVWRSKRVASGMVAAGTNGG